MKKQHLQKILPFALAVLLTGIMAWYHHIYVNWNPSLFPIAVALSVLVFLALVVMVVWPGDAKPLKKCLQIFGWFAAFVGIQQGVSFLINNVMYNGIGGARFAMRAVLPLLAVLVILLMRGPFRALEQKVKRTIGIPILALVGLLILVTMLNLGASSLELRCGERLLNPAAGEGPIASPIPDTWQEYEFYRARGQSVRPWEPDGSPEYPLLDINVADYPRLGNEADDAPRILRAVADAPFGKVYFPAGRYFVASTIEITNKCSLLLDENAVLQAVAEMDFVITWDGQWEKPQADPPFNYSPTSAAFIKGGVIDGAGLASCLQLQKQIHFTLRDICLMNGRYYGLELLTGGYELIAHNVFLRCDMWDLPSNVGLKISGMDNHFTDIVITNYDIGVWDTAGANRYTRVHVWNWTSSDYKNSVNFRMGAGASLESCYADSGKIGFDILGGNVRLTNCDYFSGYSDEFDLDDTVVIRNQSGDLLLIVNCGFAKGTPKGRLYLGNPSENVVQRNNRLGSGLSWPLRLRFG